LNERPAIRFDSVSKKFTLHYERPRSFQELFLHALHLKPSHLKEEYWALRDVSFEVEPGEVVGVIGPNGGGKSTLLKLISRIIEPTAGQIGVDGQIRALLELGAGFHPELTGRENIYLNASIMGLSRATIQQKLDAIVDFAELEQFIDVQVKHYSSGMYVRLGFSVAVHTDPEILLVDEALAVGDVSFQRKCLERISQLHRKGTTIMFVSHDLDAVRNLCQRTLWLESGRLKMAAATDKVVGAYLDVVFRKRHKTLSEEQQQESERWGSLGIEILDVQFLDAAGQEKGIYRTGEPFIARIHYQAHEEIERPVFGVAIYRADGVHVNGPNTKFSDYRIERIQGRGCIDYIVESLPLLEGSYLFSAVVYDHTCLHPYDHQHQAYAFTIAPGGCAERYGLVHMPARWEHQE
jgi:ABC-type polysaccharide/polyol phosphate transport system ATPase subunit